MVGRSGNKPTALQRLEDSVGLLRGEMGVCAQDARYLTLHGGVGALGDDLALMQQEVESLGKGLTLAAQELDGARDEA